MRIFHVHLCDVPIIGCNFRGQLSLTREMFHFHMNIFQLLIPVDIYINCREIADLYVCSYLHFYDAIGIRTVNGKTYKFYSPTDMRILFETMKSLL